VTSDDVVIHTAKLPSDKTPAQLIVRAAPGRAQVAIDPVTAGWRYLACEVAVVPREGQLALGDARETLVVILRGGGLRASWEGGRAAKIPGRRSVWDGLPSGLYLPPGHRATLHADAVPDSREVVVAIGRAPRAGHAGVADAPIVLLPDPSCIEVRGAGHATRQITHIVKPDFPADRLLCVEVYTPGGNWSGWPPHKHDVDDFPREAVLEETYLYQIRRPEGWGVQRLYRKDGTRDAIWAVRDGDLVFMPDGYHPFSAPPLYDAYYLNFLAGDRRTMANREDPDLTWVRDTFATTPTDPRVPLVRAPDPATSG
jgi:5-deoxy-glucuronate isomerase